MFQISKEKKLVQIIIEKNSVLFLLFLIWTTIFSFQSAFPLGEMERLKNGDVIIEDAIGNEAKTGSVKMTFIIEASPEKIWNLFIEYDKWPSFMPDLDKVIIKEKKLNYAIVYVKAKAPLNLDISYVLKRVYNKKDYEITWTMIEGKAKEVEGSWHIFPLQENVCKVVYTNYVDLGFIVPPKIVSMLTKKKLPALADGIKEYLRKNK